MGRASLVPNPGGAQPPGKPLVTVESIVKDHWATYGRNYYCRYDYEGVDKPKAQAMFAAMTSATASNTGRVVQGNKIATADVFEYLDPVDGSIVSKNQGHPVPHGGRFQSYLPTVGHGGLRRDGAHVHREVRASHRCSARGLRERRRRPREGGAGAVVAGEVHGHGVADGDHVVARYPPPPRRTLPRRLILVFFSISEPMSSSESSSSVSASVSASTSASVPISSQASAHE